MKKRYKALGLMSGSSLDGLDIAYCQMDWDGEQVVDWELLSAATLPFSEIWQTRLEALPQQSAEILAKTHVYFGYYMGELVNTFLQQEGIGDIDFVASHGHTVFHNPDRRFGLQIGHGGALAATLGRQVVCDFRTQDIALSGEGAPLAPLADAYLFSGYDFYLNLGGIANISACIAVGDWVAFDLAPANQVFNFFAATLGLPYDAEGQLAAKGRVDMGLLEELRRAAYYQKPFPKSMSNEWIRSAVLPLLIEADLPLPDTLATAVELCALELAAGVQLIRQKKGLTSTSAKMLVTGGGAFNLYLLRRIEAHLAPLGVELLLPSSDIICFKEALLMALLGLLRLEGLPNSWPQLTGAQKPTVNGAVYRG